MKGRDISYTKCEVDGVTLNAMIDSGSISTFMNKSMAKKLNLFIIPKNKSVSLADENQKAQIVGEVIVNLKLNNNTYNGIVVEVIDGLFIDFIVGKDIHRKHNKVVFKFNGPQKGLIIGAVGVDSDSFPEMKVLPPPLFTHLSENIKPIATKSRRFTAADFKFIKEETKRLLKEKIIEPSVSPWRAQVLTATNGDHKKRMVIDYSDTINIFTELDAYPMPNISKMVEDISKYSYFSTLDLKSAYYQIPIWVEDHKYTAFEVDGKLFQFTRLPFGVTNGISAFQRSINNVIENESLTDTFAYVDNVTICGRTKEEHDKNLKPFYETSEKYNITFNKSKSILSATSITLLGYTIENNQISPDYKRLKPLLEMPPPTDLKSQKGIIGMFSYYCKFIKDF